MSQARPAPTFQLLQPQGRALQSLAETLLETFQGTMNLDMKIGMAAGNDGEIQLQHNRLVLKRPLAHRTAANSATQIIEADEVEM